MIQRADAEPRLNSGGRVATPIPPPKCRNRVSGMNALDFAGNRASDTEGRALRTNMRRQLDMCRS
ncbi:MAG: hypothetical protein QM813_21465 [Verrucomicrobiota bacterium]